MDPLNALMNDAHLDDAGQPEISVARAHTQMTDAEAELLEHELLLRTLEKENREFSTALWSQTLDRYWALQDEIEEVKLKAKEVLESRDAKETGVSSFDELAAYLLDMGERLARLAVLRRDIPEQIKGRAKREMLNDWVPSHEH